jgi:hypothetical protein
MRRHVNDRLPYLIALIGFHIIFGACIFLAAATKKWQWKLLTYFVGLLPVAVYASIYENLQYSLLGVLLFMMLTWALIYFVAKQLGN